MSEKLSREQLEEALDEIGTEFPDWEWIARTLEDVAVWSLGLENALIIQRDEAGNWPEFLLAALADHMYDPWTVQAVIERASLAACSESILGEQ
jgi:hypothetical protein